MRFVFLAKPLSPSLNQHRTENNKKHLPAQNTLWHSVYFSAESTNLGWTTPGLSVSARSQVRGVQVSSAWCCIRKINFLPQLKWQRFRPFPSLCPYWSPKQLYSHPGCSVHAAINGNLRQRQPFSLPADEPCGTSVTRVRPHHRVCPAEPEVCKSENVWILRPLKCFTA